MTWIKICGVTSPETAVRVVERAPSAIGLNFYQPSPRYVDVPTASSIRNAVGSDIELIGVFVNSPLNEIKLMVDETGLDGVQLHGDETVDQYFAVREALPAVKICKAFRIGEDGLSPVRAWLNECREKDSTQNCLPSRILVDARVAGMFGGSGKVINWDLVNESQRDDWFPEMILAGGLKPSNIADAITSVAPWGIDVASGVEDATGDKDNLLMDQLINNIRG